MKDINTNVIRVPFSAYLLLSLLISVPYRGWADDRVTRVYMLKNADITTLSPVLNVVIRDPAHTRVIGGEGRRVVITDTPEQQDNIAQLLPVLDQPTNETNRDKIQMKMMMNAAQYLRQQKIAVKPAAASGPAASGAPAANPASATSASAAAGGPAPADKFKVAAYKSIYASDDAKLKQGPRDITGEPVLPPSLGAMRLRGIFRAHTSSPLALLFYEGLNYTAHDGGLFENNHVRVKDVTTKVLKDRVILVGQDHKEHEIKFQTSP